MVSHFHFTTHNLIMKHPVFQCFRNIHYLEDRDPNRPRKSKEVLRLERKNDWEEHRRQLRIETLQLRLNQIDTERTRIRKTLTELGVKGYNDAEID